MKGTTFGSHNSITLQIVNLVLNGFNLRKAIESHPGEWVQYPSWGSDRLERGGVCSCQPSILVFGWSCLRHPKTLSSNNTLSLCKLVLWSSSGLRTGVTKQTKPTRSRKTLMLSFPHRTQTAQGVNVSRPISAAFFPACSDE